MSGQVSRQILIYGVVCLAILIVPVLVDDAFLLNKYARYLIFGMLAIALSLSWGYAGILNLGQATTFGLGSYCMAMLLKLKTVPIHTGSDGLPDFITGKRFWSHLDTFIDPDPHGAPVLYVYRTVRNPKAPGGAEFVPELVHNRSGVGSHVTAVDLNKDGKPEIITSTKRGTFIFWNQWNTGK